MRTGIALSITTWIWGNLVGKSNRSPVGKSSPTKQLDSDSKPSMMLAVPIPGGNFNAANY
jgi:hypothetical protein